MAGHRLGRLLVRAAVGGIIDFAQADLRDPAWHRRLGLIVDEMLRQDKLKSLELLHTKRLAVMQCFAQDPERFNKYAEEEAELLEDYFDTMHGRPAQKEARKVRMAKKLKQAWSQEFGDPSNPEVQQSIDAVAEYLRLRRTEKPKKTRTKT